MDIFSAIKDWLSNLFGDAAGTVTDTAASATENLNVEELQQQLTDNAQNIGQQGADAVDQVKSNLPGQQ